MPKTAVANTTMVQEENYDKPFILDHSKSNINWDMPSPHKHNCHELYYLLNGSTQYCIEDDIYNVSPGDIVIVPQGVFHRTLCKSPKSYERQLIFFSQQFASPFYTQLGMEAFNNFLNLGSVRIAPRYQNQIQELFVRLDKENIRSDIYSEMALSHIFCELIVLILRHGSSMEKTSSKTENRLLDAIHYINNHYNQEITLHQISQLSYMEATYFSKCFHKFTGLSFQEYVINTRLKFAEDFLANSPLSISEIAENCGFLSSNYFGDIFKKYRGVSPREYRKKMQK